MRDVAVFAMAVTLVIPVVVHSESRAKIGGTIEASLTSEPRWIDPLLAQTYTDVQLTSLIHESLYRMGADGPSPVLAAELPRWVNKLTARISIRPSTFHSGVAVNASDVAASLERARLGRFSAALEFVASISVDGTDVVIALRSPMPRLATLLALPQLAILPGGVAPSDTTVGAGPFVWSTPISASRSLELNAYVNHVSGRPFVDRLKLRWFDAGDAEARRFEAGQSHVSLRGATAFAGAKPAFASSKLESAATVLTFVGFCSRSPAVAHPSFRRGLDVGVARGGMTSLGQGEKIIPTTTPVPNNANNALLLPGSPSDLTSATAELFAAFPRLSAETATNPLQLLVDNSVLDDHEVAERVIRALDKLGVTARVVGATNRQFNDTLSNQSCDMYIGQLTLPADNAMLWWTQSYALGRQQSKSSMADMAASFRKELPIVPLFHRGVRLWQRNDVQGLRLDELGNVGYDNMFVIGLPQTQKQAAAASTANNKR
jgi:MarR-like DNA-binding transcriptional regulator SgrR of sgrS sRNA